MQTNRQTPGPFRVDMRNGGDEWPTLRDAQGVPVAYTPDAMQTIAEAQANARTLAAGFNLLDKAGRALGMDAATLGESLDLAALVQALRSIHDDAAHALGTEAEPQDRLSVARQDLDAIRATARAALSTLPPSA